MTIFGRVVRWLRGRPVWAGNRYDPGDTKTLSRHSKRYLILIVIYKNIIGLLFTAIIRERSLWQNTVFSSGQSDQI